MSSIPHRVKIQFYSGWWIPLGDDKYQAEKRSSLEYPQRKDYPGNRLLIISGIDHQPFNNCITTRLTQSRRRKNMGEVLRHERRSGKGSFQANPINESIHHRCDGLSTLSPVEDLQTFEKLNTEEQISNIKSELDEIGRYRQYLVKNASMISTDFFKETITFLDRIERISLCNLELQKIESRVTQSQDEGIAKTRESLKSANRMDEQFWEEFKKLKADRNEMEAENKRLREHINELQNRPTIQNAGAVYINPVKPAA